jgi:hypothetical protein
MCCPYSMSATIVALALAAAVFVGGPLAVLWRDNRKCRIVSDDLWEPPEPNPYGNPLVFDIRGQCQYCGCMTDGPTATER